MEMDKSLYVNLKVLELTDCPLLRSTVIIFWDIIMMKNLNISSIMSKYTTIHQNYRKKKHIPTKKISIILHIMTKSKQKKNVVRERQKGCPQPKKMLAKRQKLPRKARNMFHHTKLKCLKKEVRSHLSMHTTLMLSMALDVKKDGVVPSMFSKHQKVNTLSKVKLWLLISLDLEKSRLQEQVPLASTILTYQGEYREKLMKGTKIV